MSEFSRRDFALGIGAAGASLGFAETAFAQAKKAAVRPPHVVVIGGGFGGATVAKYLRLMDPKIRVTLVEPSPVFITCPFSNLVLGGLKSMPQITHTYAGLTRRGVTVARAAATKVDAAKKTVTLSTGQTLTYDKLVMSPGVDMRWNAIQGYDEKASEIMPHAWKAGPQTALLKKQLDAMKDGGTFVLVAPADPFRCPPGPYERVSMVAHYLKAKKPKSKILILDAKENFSKQGLFMEGWRALYGNMIEFVPASKDGKIVKVDPKTMTLEGELGAKHKGDVVNLVPPQRSGAIASVAGVADNSGWCPINPVTWESTLQKDIHVIGDATIAAPMPKSGFSASSQAKMCAAAIVATLDDKAPPSPSMANTCYSLVGPDYGISIAAVYRVEGGKIVAVQGAGGVSPTGANAEFRKAEARYGEGWYRAITADTWG